VLDAGGYSGWSTLSGANIADLTLPPLDEAEALCAQLWQDIVVANVSKYEQDDVTPDADPLPADYVFVPLQVAGDRTQRVARFSMPDMLDMVVNRFRGTDTVVVVKPHPKSKDMEQVAKLIAMTEAGEIMMRFDSIHHLIAGAKAVITINSGVGSETLLHRKPLYCLGAADYDCVAHRITSVEQFTDLTTPIRHAVPEADYVRFSAYYRKDYLVDWARPGRLDAAVQERVIDPILAGR
jgi:capsule polysaccharide modification protein KpsS